MLQSQQFTDGALMWTGGYSDMPYMADLGDGVIFSTLSVTPGGGEGGSNQHIVGLRSTDNGLTWATASLVEPVGPPVGTWGMPWYDQGANTLYVFYIYNADNTTYIPSNDGPGYTTSYYATGYIAWRTSNDGGLTWSARSVATMPTSAIDLENPFGGAQKMFWCCGHPQVHNGKLYFGVSKAGIVKGNRRHYRTEAFLVGASLPGLNDWAAYPSSGRGLKGPSDALIATAGSAIGEEPSFVIFDDGVIYMVCRTDAGYVADGWSTDGGLTFTYGWAREVDGTTPVPNTRAKCAIFSLGDGRYLMWHHNLAVTAPDDPGWGEWKRRNPVWYRIGHRFEDRLIWGDPAVLIYDKGDALMSYPSLIVRDDELLVSCTNKSDARVFRFPLSAI